jgi:hypothetical protein
MEQLTHYIHDALLDHPVLTDAKDEICFVLSGSRAVNYQVPSSDYDLLGICTARTYSHVHQLAGRDPFVKGIDIPIDKEEAKRRFGIEVDVAIYEYGQIRQAMHRYNDVVIWIWTHAQFLLGPESLLADLKSTFRGYPRTTLERKLKHHFLTDFHLSVHGLTYRPESQNLFSVLYALTSKIAQYCRLCCLLDSKPFPYEKWLLRACAETPVGQRLFPIFTRVLAILTRLNNDLEQNWGMVRQAIDAIDTEACDIVQEAMVSWGIDKEWIENSYYRLADVLFR